MEFNYNKMNSCCVEMETVIQHIKQILDAIKYIQLQLSKSDCWNGRASSFYLEKMNTFTNTFEVTKQELDQIVNYLKNVVEGYQSVDNKITSEVNNLLNIRKW